jgi:hypothetical protein
VHQFDVRRQELVEAEVHDRVRLAAADLHDRPWSGHAPLELG